MTPDFTNLPDEAQHLLEHLRKQRIAYGLPPDPPKPLTLSEMKEGEARNAAAAITDAIYRYGGTRAGTDAHRVWLSHNPVHDRDLPAFAHQTVAADCWAADEAEALAIIAWGQPEWPGQYPSRDWRALFTRVGEQVPLPLCSDEDCPIPHNQPLRIWRAAFVSEKRGLAWTTHRNTATWFATRGDMSGRGRTMRLWTTTVPAERVYAHITRRGESEVVCDVRGLPLDEEDVTIPPNAEKYDRSGGHWWVKCTQGHTHYGENGAAGILLRHTDPAGNVRVLLHQRNPETDQAGTLGYPGGAIDDTETPEQAARREMAEETGLTDLPSAADQFVLDHGTWTYTTFIIDVADAVVPDTTTWEASKARWVAPSEVGDMLLVGGAAEAIRHAAEWQPE